MEQEKVMRALEFHLKLQGHLTAQGAVLAYLKATYPDIAKTHIHGLLEAMGDSLEAMTREYADLERPQTVQ